MRKEVDNVESKAQEKIIREKYIAYKEQEVPELWDRIEQALPEKKEKKNKLFIRRAATYSSVAAAVLLLCCFAAYRNSGMQGDNSVETSETQMQESESKGNKEEDTETLKEYSNQVDSYKNNAKQEAQVYDTEAESNISLELVTNVDIEDLMLVESVKSQEHRSKDISEFLAQLSSPYDLYQNEAGTLYVLLENNLYVVKE